MKKIVLIAATLFCFVVAEAQITKDSLLKVMTGEVCTKIGKKDFTGKSEKDIQMEMGLAMLPIIEKYADEIKDIYNTDITDPESMKKLGIDIGFRLATQCPDFMKMMMKGADNSAPTIVSVKAYELSGTLVKVVNGDFTYFVIKDETGKMQKVWWMEYFNGADKLAQQVNKKITVNYTEKEVYNATLKDYVKIKIAAGVE